MKNILFDWSGVIKNTVQSQLWIVNRIFEKYGVDAITLEEFRENWEQPYTVFYKKYLPEGFNEEERAQAYRNALFHKDCPTCSIFPGMAEILHACKSKDFFLAVVSSDLPETLHAEMKQWGLGNIFNEVATSMDNKLEAVQKIIESNHLNPLDTFFVGDSNHEIDVAKKVGIKSIAVTWGFTSEQKLIARKPDYLIHTVQELKSIIS